MEKYRYKELGRKLSNWGRWGEDDNIGTLNYITPELVKRAAGSIRSGKRFELSIEVGPSGPQLGTVETGNRINPVHLFSMLPSDWDTDDGLFYTDDYVIMPLQSGTQWDGLTHCGYDGYFYNAAPASSITPMGGATLRGVEHVLPGVVGRGVLLDIARIREVDVLDESYAVSPDDLTEAEQAQGVTVGTGDIVLVRTGWLTKGLREGYGHWLEREPGLTVDCAEWLHEREVAALAADNWGVEVLPSPDRVDHGHNAAAEQKLELFTPLHCVALRDMGMMLGENFQLQDLADDCAEDGQWDFLFSAPPLRIRGASGSPISPIAIK